MPERNQIDDADEELLALRLDYLRDLGEKVELIRHHAQGLASRGAFKTSFPVLLFLAHQLKGSGGTLGFPRVTQLARSMSQELNFFLDDEQTPRPTPQQLSEKLLALSEEFGQEIASAGSSLAR